MSCFDCDLMVIGGGSAGIRAAHMAAHKGARVIVAEAGALGGTCVNAGCIPKKLYSYASHFGKEFKDAAGYGWRVSNPHFDWATLKLGRALEIKRLNSVYKELLAVAGVQVVQGLATVLDPYTVEVRADQEPHRFTARNILIAVGGRPRPPTFAGGQHVIGSDAIFDLKQFPNRLLIVGGGYIACEFASIFNGLGSTVTQLCRGSQILRGFDDDVRGFLGQAMCDAGVDLRFECGVLHVKEAGKGVLATLSSGETILSDAILHATGRLPNTKGMGLESLGMAVGVDGEILVDDHYRTSVPSIYAAGDAIGRFQLTPVALAEAMSVVKELFGAQQRAMDYKCIPTAVFTQPEVATVGFSEAEAREHFEDVAVYRSMFTPLKQRLTINGSKVLLKLIVDSATDRVVGLHMVGAEASEIVQGFTVAIRAGATKAVFDSTLGIHPTVAEEFVTMRAAATDR